MNRLTCAIALALVTSACGHDPGGSNPMSHEAASASPQATAAPTAPTAPAQAANAPTAPAAGEGAQGPIAELKVSTTGATMAFDVTKFEVTAGQTVHVVFTNKTPGALGHNWVLLKPGKEAAFAASVLDKPGYFTDSPDVLAHTDLILPGKSSEATFTAPSEPGNYPYICSFPGHYMMMKGVLVVKAR